MVSGQVIDEVGEQLADLGVEGVLDAVETWHAAQRHLESRVFMAAAHFADLHHPDTRPDTGGRVLPGSERGIRLGGVGTPKVLEFAPAEFAARIRKSPCAGRAMVADALDTRHRLPKLWARVRAGEVPVSFARHVAQKTRDLTVEGAGVVDAGVVTSADGRISWARFENLVAAKVIEADPAAAAERERLAAEEEFVRVGRTNEHGQKTMYINAPAHKIIRVKASIGFFGDALGDLGHPGTQDERETDALVTMANPPQAVQLLLAAATHRAGAGRTPGAGQPDDEPDTLDNCDDPHAGGEQDTGAGSQDLTVPQRFRPHQIRPDTRFTMGFDPRKLMPRVVLYLHLYARTDTGHLGPVARWEGEGPVTTAYVRDLLGPACEFTIKPVIDLDNMAPVDAYEIPDRHREAVHLRTPADVFPYASNTGRHQQLDHTKPYVPPDHGGPPGQTALENLGPMTGFHHRVKTHGRWQVKQPFPGIYLWRDPHGHTYLVDHTGTRPVGTTDSGNAMPDIAIDIMPAEPGIELHYRRPHVA